MVCSKSLHCNKSLSSQANNNHCKGEIMNYKRLSISIISVFAFVFILEFFVHGYLLEDLYSQTSDLWREKDDFLMHYMTLSQFGLKVAISLSRRYMDSRCSSTARSRARLSFLVLLMVIMLKWAGACVPPRACKRMRPTQAAA